MMMRVLAVALSLLAGCGGRKDQTNRDPASEPRTPPQPTNVNDPWADPVQGATLVEARARFQTTIIGAPSEPGAPPEPPPPEFRLVKYDAPPGQLAAYVTAGQGDGKHPALIWIVGGDTNSIGDVWSPSDRDNDQTARQYRDAGIVTMYPSQRGGNDNPGRREGFYGEVDDILAAARFLAKQPYVDPEQLYLGGHSTGGTLALLVAAAAPRGLFRAVIAFGPIHDVTAYGDPNPFCPFDTRNPAEVDLRAPRRWINTVSTPTFVLEGEQGNVNALQLLQLASSNPLVQFFAIPDADHFNVLAPLNQYLASRIVGAWSKGAPELTHQALIAAMNAK